MSNFKKNKLTKKVWFGGLLYDVVKVFSPTHYDHYILVKREMEENVHDDGKTTPVEMFLIDANNDEFFPDIPEVREIMKKLKEDEKSRKVIEEKLKDIWLDMLGFTVEKYLRKEKIKWPQH
jgi:hypothetical protein